MLTLTLIALLVTAGLVAADQGRAHHLRGQWWEDLILDERLAGQLHLRQDARAALRTLAAHDLAARRPGLTQRAEREARHMLAVLRREIPETRDALRALEEAETRRPDDPGSASSSGPWAIPTYIVMCESGGDYGAMNSSSGAYGAYQIMPFHWSSGVCVGLGKNPAGQDECARRIWESAGAGAWVCS